MGVTAGPVDLSKLFTSDEHQELFVTASYALEAAALVRQMREFAGLTQAELARGLNVQQPRVAVIEKGDGPNGPTYALLKRIARVCGVKLTFKIEHA